MAPRSSATQNQAAGKLGSAAPHPFVLTLFDLMQEAIPLGDVPQALRTESESNFCWVFANLDQGKWVPVLAELARGHDPAGLPGFRPRCALDPARQVFMQEEYTAPNYRSSAIYNEFLRPLKCEHTALVQLKAQGELLGDYPLYRSPVMKPFDQQDRKFLIAAAPHIAHGVQAARLIKALAESPDPSRSGAAPGVAVMDQDGSILGIDRQARSLFFQLAMHDGIPMSAFAEPHLRSLLAYVARTLRAVFDDRARTTSELAPPAARIVSHTAGMALRLVGYSTPGEGGDMFVVLVEELESETFLRARLMYRYSLASREAEVLTLLRRGTSVARIGKELGITTPTAKTYVRNLIDKLELPNLTALRAVF